jgi:hypothetical protein
MLVVRVPVLSEQMTLVQPRVFLTSFPLITSRSRPEAVVGAVAGRGEAGGGEPPGVGQAVVEQGDGALLLDHGGGQLGRLGASAMLPIRGSSLAPSSSCAAPGSICTLALGASCDIGSIDVRPGL